MIILNTSFPTFPSLTKAAAVVSVIMLAFCDKRTCFKQLSWNTHVLFTLTSHWSELDKMASP
jgi:hypothetical protein